MKRSKKEVQPHWRPNFVDPAGLPDIKAIRTDFIINIVAVLLMLLVGFYLVQREYRSHSLSKTIADMEERIQAAESEDKKSLRLSKQFRDAAETVAELEKFYEAPMLAHEFLAEITTLRPDDLIFQKIAFTEVPKKEGASNMVVYSITISGDARSLTVLDEFKGELSTWDRLNVETYELQIDESLQGRDKDTGIFPYTLEITLSPRKAGDAAEDKGDA
ncbi:MAG: hypothetical protein AAF065_13445 [Verrucomicrobiota bacterium]